MAKKKKSKGSGNPVLDALTEMLSVMSPEEKMQLMANLENIAQSGMMRWRIHTLISVPTIPRR